MNPKRREQVRQVYHAALELEPGRREEFPKEACAEKATPCAARFIYTEIRLDFRRGLGQEQTETE